MSKIDTFLLTASLIAHTEDSAHEHHAGKRERTAVRKERERESRHGHEADSHRDVHDDVEQENRAGPHGEDL